MIRPISPLAKSAMRLTSSGVQEPSSVAKPSQVAERTNRFFSRRPPRDVASQGVGMVNSLCSRSETDLDAVDVATTWTGTSPATEPVLTHSTHVKD